MPRTAPKHDDKWKRLRALRRSLRIAAVDRALLLDPEALEHLVAEKELAAGHRLRAAIARVHREADVKRKARAKRRKPFKPPPGMKLMSEEFYAAWEAHRAQERARLAGPMEDEAVVRREAVRKKVRDALTAVEVDALLPEGATGAEWKELFGHLVPFAALDLRQAAAGERPHTRWVELAEERAAYPYREALRILRARAARDARRAARTQGEELGRRRREARR